PWGRRARDGGRDSCRDASSRSAGRPGAAAGRVAAVRWTKEAVMETRVEWMTGAGGLLAGSLLLATSCSAGVADASDPAADAAAEARPPVGVVDTLPLRRGYYVRAE